MNLPNCVPGMQAADLKELGGLADFRAAYQQQARQQFVPPANLLAQQQVRQYGNWTAPHAQNPFGYQTYPYQLYPNQPQLHGWQQVNQVPDLKAALTLPQQQQPLASLSSDLSQSSREEAQLASFLQAQQTFLQRGTSSLSASLAPSAASYGTSPSRPPIKAAAAAAAAVTSPSRPPPLSSASFVPDRSHQQPKAPPEPTASTRRGPTPTPAATTSLASHASHCTASHALSPLAPPSTVSPAGGAARVSDDLLMRVVRGEGSAIDTLSQSCAAHPLRPAPSAATASHPGSMWSKPTHTQHPCPSALCKPPSTSSPTAAAQLHPLHHSGAASPALQPHPDAPPPSQQAAAVRDAQLEALAADPAAVKALLGSTNYYRARMTMLDQQELFLQQLFELHRLVATQKLLAAELRHPEHSPALMHQTVSQQKAQLEQQLRRDLHLLRNIPATLRNPWLAQAPLDPPPTAVQFRITKDSSHGKSLPRPTPQHPTARRPPLPTSAPPPAWASHASQPLPHLRTPTTSLPPVPLDLAPPTSSSKPTTLIRPVPTALQPPPAMYQPVDIHSMWVAKHGATSASLSSANPQPSTSFAPISLPSHMTGQQLTGLSSDCIASFGLGLSSLSGCTNSLAQSLKDTSTHQRTRVRYWWQDEAGAFADVGLPDDLQLASRTRGESSSVAVSAREGGRDRAGDPSAPPKKRAKFKDSSQALSGVQTTEAPTASAADRPAQQGERQQGGAANGTLATPSSAGKDTLGKSRQEASGGKKPSRSKRIPGARAGGANHSGDSGSSECSAPTQERAHTAAESVPPQPSGGPPAAAASKEDTVTDHRLDLLTNQSTAHSAANILLSISSSFRPI